MAVTEQLGRPTHRAASSAAALAWSSHAASCVRLAGHAPVGVPHAAKAMPAIGRPPGQPKSSGWFSPTTPHATGKKGGLGGGGTAVIDAASTG